MDLFEAIERGHEDDVSRLLDADPNSLETKNHQGLYGPWYRPLEWAAFNGQLGMMRLLVERGANVHATGHQGRTALFYAAAKGHEEMVAFLLSQGAQVDIRAMDNETHLMAAAFHTHVGVVKMLLQHMGGQGLNQTDREGRTALYNAAIRRGGEEVIRILLLAGADPSIANNGGRTPLACAQLMRHGGSVAVFEVSMTTVTCRPHSVG
jgi:ankyrin repeat protein